MEIYILVIVLITTFFDILPKATRSPSGSEKISVNKKNLNCCHHPGTKLGNHYLKAHIKRTPIFFYCKTNALLFAERADIITEILVGYFCECAVLYHL